MNTLFDKIYVISLISNKERQEFITYQMNKLNIDFEFLYGIDFYNLKNDRYGKIINYPNVIEYDNLDNDKTYGCTLGHYKAVLQAYEFGYNNVLIIEDDMCFTKNIDMLSFYLNNIPKDADLITYTARFFLDEDVNKFNSIKYTDKYNYINLYKYDSLCGCGMYGIMNRKTMKLYLENQREKFNCSDHIPNIFRYSTIIRYTALHAICLDQFNVCHHGNFDNMINIGCYIQLNKIKDYNDFYKPNKYNISTLNNLVF